jgi:hypothetical protein
MKPTRRSLLLIGLSLVIGFALGYWFRGWSDRDACFDHGGAWNDQVGYCEKVRSGGG